MSERSERGPSGSAAGRERTTSEPLLELGDHVTSVAWSPDGTHLAAGSLAGDGQVVAPDGAVVAKLAGHPFGVLALAWSPDGCTLAVGGQDGTASLWDATGGDAHRLEVRGWVAALAWRPDGGALAIAAGRTVTIRDTATGVMTCGEAMASTVTSLAWAPAGDRLAAGCYGGVHWLDPATAATVETYGWKGSILALAMAADGRWIASGNQDDSVHLWRIPSGEDLQMSGYPAKIEHLAWDRRSRWLAVGSIGDVTLWDVSGKGPAGRSPVVLGGHARRVVAVTWQGDGNLLAAASADGLVKVWDITRSKKRPVRSAALGGEPGCLAWRPATTELAVGMADGTVVRVAAR